MNTFDDYEKALKNTLLNKSAIESPDNKFVDITIKDVQRVLHTVLVLLWTMPLFMAKHSVKIVCILQNSNLMTERKMR